MGTGLDQQESTLSKEQSGLGERGDEGRTFVAGVKGNCLQVRESYRRGPFWGQWENKELEVGRPGCYPWFGHRVHILQKVNDTLQVSSPISQIKELTWISGSQTFLMKLHSGKEC